MAKSFRTPIDAFVSAPAEEIPVEETKAPEAAVDEETPSGKPPKGYKLNPKYVETKSKRVQLLMQPSLYEAVKAAAVKRGISVNEAFAEAAAAWIRKQK